MLRNLLQKRIDKYEFIEKYRTSRYAVSSLCRVLKVGEAAFYAWRTGKTYQPSQKRRELAGAVKEVFYLHRRKSAEREEYHLNSRMRVWQSGADLPPA